MRRQRGCGGKFGTARRRDGLGAGGGRRDGPGGGRSRKLDADSVKARALAALESSDSSDDSECESSAERQRKMIPRFAMKSARSRAGDVVTPEKNVSTNAAPATGNGREHPPSSGQGGVIDLTGSDSEEDGGLPAQIDLTGDDADEDGEASAQTKIDLTGEDSDSGDEAPDAGEKEEGVPLPASTSCMKLPSNKPPGDGPFTERLSSNEPGMDSGEGGAKPPFKGEHRSGYVALPRSSLAGSGSSEGSRTPVHTDLNGDGTTSPSDLTGGSSGEDASDDTGAPLIIERAPVAAGNYISKGKKSRRQEVGYVLLEECEVLIPAGSFTETPASGVWQGVDLQTALKSSDDGEMGEHHDLPDDCDLILQRCASEDDLLWRSALDITPFNGLLSEIAVNASRDSSKRRSDASLLAGLAVEINEQAEQYRKQPLDGTHFRDIQTENLQIMFWGEAPRGTSRALQLDGEVEEANKWRRTQASLLMTFSLPSREERQKRATGKTLQSSGKSKMLSSAHTLLGSIVRCDWAHLDARMKILQRRAKAVKRGDGADLQRDQKLRKPFFPDLLSVEELYHRISGAGKHLGGNEMAVGPSPSEISDIAAGSDPEGRNNSIQQPAVANAAFQDIPEEVLVTSIAPYLRARSLHALRVTNRKLFRSLRGVVPGLKKLKLFRHQVRSLEWMEMRERQCVTEEDVLGRHKNRLPFGECSFLHEGEAVCGGDYHRAVTGGATVLLAPRHTSTCDQADMKGALRFDSESGDLSSTSDDDGVRRQTRCARGGLLCDDPGLGKTITVISLILRSFGLSSETSEVTDQSTDDDALFYSYWHSSFLTEHVRKPAILKLISRLIKSDAESGWFVPPIEQFLDECPDYLDVIPNPTSLQAVRNKCNKSDCRDFRGFEADVRLCFSNAMTYNPPGHDVYEAAERLSRNFDELLAIFKQEQIDVAAKSVSRMAKDEASRPLVDLFEAKKIAELAEPLVGSHSTLLVVPQPLLKHWEEQILLHIDFGYLASGGSDLPLIYYHTSKRKIQITDSRISTDLGSISNPLIFIDDGSRELPSPNVLAQFPIVLTSYNRFTSEWKCGSVESEMRASGRGSGANYWGEGDAPEASPLLKVSWLRVIVDEGHVMGKSANNLIQFCSWLAAQRHWAMTGTPTQQIAAQNGLKQLFHLTNFLKHEFFNQRLGREKVWNRFIRDGWKYGSLASFFRLKHTLAYLMVRHTKADLVEIPPPVLAEVPITLSQREVTTYNTLASSIGLNIVATTMEGKTSGWIDSFLNPRQAKTAKKTLTNLRVSCCGGTHIVPQISTKNWNETLLMLREIHKLDDTRVKVVNDFIVRAQSAELTSCQKCGIQITALFIIPCGHLVCTECIDNKTTKCPVCLADFDTDDFQRLQPGFDFQPSPDLDDELREREKRNALRRALVDSTGARDAAVNVEDLENLDVGDNRLVERQARSHKKGEYCIYSSRYQDGKCTICREEHYGCNFFNSEKQCAVCFKSAEECPSHASKAKYVIDKLLQLRSSDIPVSPLAARFFATSKDKDSMSRPLKAIVFSQEKVILEYFGDRLIRRLGGACVAEYSDAKTRAEEAEVLQKFAHQPECFVMLLSKKGSVGLDLSFVTHIFFLESIYDKSLEAQVVARAYRMGAKGPVFVEQLTAKDSVEEVMNKINAGQQVEADNSVLLDRLQKPSKDHRLLVSAKLIRPRKDGTSKKRKLVHDDGAEVPQQHGEKRAKKRAGVRFIE